MLEKITFIIFNLLVNATTRRRLQSGNTYYNNSFETNLYVGLTPLKNGSGFNGSVEVYAIKCRNTVLIF